MNTKTTRLGFGCCGLFYSQRVACRSQCATLLTSSCVWNLSIEDLWAFNPGLRGKSSSGQAYHVHHGCLCIMTPIVGGWCPFHVTSAGHYGRKLACPLARFCTNVCGARLATAATHAAASWLFWCSNTSQSQRLWYMVVVCDMQQVMLGLRTHHVNNRCTEHLSSGGYSDGKGKPLQKPTCHVKAGGYN